MLACNWHVNGGASCYIHCNSPHALCCLQSSVLSCAIYSSINKSVMVAETAAVFNCNGVLALLLQ